MSCRHEPLAGADPAMSGLWPGLSPTAAVAAHAAGRAAQGAGRCPAVGTAATAGLR